MSIQLMDVTHVYMENTPFQKIALRQISFTIEKGEFIGIIGHTGSGKSTLMQHLNGLLKPSIGKVMVNGVDLAQKNVAAKRAKQKVGMVFQYPEHQLFEETVYDDIAFGPRNFQLSEEEVDKRVRQAMEFVNLDFSVYRNRSPFQLSGGQMRRVAIAGVVALEPEYLILDEPAAGLDPCGRDEIFSRILKLYQKTNIAVILVSHNMDEVARLATRLLVLHEGSVLLDGSPERVFAEEEKLSMAGLAVPQMIALLKKIQAAGISIPAKALSPQAAAVEITKALQGGRKC